MWLLVVSRSSDYWLGLSPCITPIALVDVEVCLGIPLCVTHWVPRGSRGLILGSTGRGASHSWEYWKGAPLFVSRQCFPNIQDMYVVNTVSASLTEVTFYWYFHFYKNFGSVVIYSMKPSWHKQCRKLLHKINCIYFWINLCEIFKRW